MELDLDGEKRRKMLHLIMAETRCKILGESPLEISTTAPQAPLVADRILREFSFNQLARGAMNLLPYGRIQAGAAFFSKGCSAGITLLSVDPDGSIRPALRYASVQDRKYPGEKPHGNLDQKPRLDKAKKQGEYPRLVRALFNS
jgi:hypothetical protein